MKLKPAPRLTDAELIAEIEALQHAERISTPIGMACEHDKRMVSYDYLELISRELQAVERGTTKRLAIFTPPQVGKSQTTTIWFVFWLLTRHPTYRIILTSYAESLALEKSKKIQDIVADHGATYGLYKRRGSWTDHDWSLTTGGGVRAVGLGGGLTGHSADVIIIDDPHKDRAQANSTTYRNRAEEWFSAVALSRLTPTGAVVMVSTRWHHDDLPSRVLAKDGTLDQGGKWKVVTLPALARDNDPLGRRPGEPLMRPGITPGDTAAALAHWEDKRQSSTVFDWNALYQADPQPAEGALLTEKFLITRRITDPPEYRKSAVAIDPSGGGRDTAGIIAGSLGVDGNLYLTHDYTAVISSERWTRQACLLAHETNAELFIIESNYGGDLGRMGLRTAWKALQDEGIIPSTSLCPMLKMVHGKKGKLLRAEPIAQQWKEGRIYTVGALLDLESEWCTWQPDDPSSPGRIDASVYLAYELLPVPGSEAVISSPHDINRDQIPSAGATGVAGIRKNSILPGRRQYP